MYMHVLPCCHSRTCNFPWPATSPITSGLTAQSAWVPRADITFKIILQPKSDSVSKSRHFFLTSSQITHHLTIANPRRKKNGVCSSCFGCLLPSPYGDECFTGFLMVKCGIPLIFVSRHSPSSLQGEGPSGCLTEQKGPISSITGHLYTPEDGTLGPELLHPPLPMPPNAKS